MFDKGCSVQYTVPIMTNESRCVASAYFSVYNGGSKFTTFKMRFHVVFLLA